MVVDEKDDLAPLSRFVAGVRTLQRVLAWGAVATATAGLAAALAILGTRLG